jgi:hypothetical protein
MRAPTRRVAAVAALLLLAPGCDRFYSIDRTVLLPCALPRADVEAALKEVPGVERVDYACMKGADGLLYDRYTYHGKRFRDRYGDMGGVLEFRPDAEGGGRLRMYLNWLNHCPSRQVADSFRTGMDEVYASLSKRVEGMPPASTVRESLNGIPDR